MVRGANVVNRYYGDEQREILDMLDADVTWSAQEFAHGPYPLKNASIELHLRDGKLTLTNVTGNLVDGRFSAGGTIDTLQAPRGLVLGWAIALLLPILLYVLDLGSGSLWHGDDVQVASDAAFASLLAEDTPSQRRKATP